MEGVEIFDDDDSITVSPRSLSTRTGIFASGQSALNAAAERCSPKSTIRGSKPMPFS